MTITISKKHVVAFLAIILVMVFAFVLYKCSLGTKYVDVAKDMKTNSMVLKDMTYSILKDYQENWQNCISNNRAKNDEGEYQYCYEFSEAVAWRYSYYSKNGSLRLMDSLANAIKEDMVIMDDAPSKYKKTQESFLSIYNDINTLYSLVKEPKGSLLTFGQTINELVMRIDSKIKETDLKIPVSQEETLAKIAVIEHNKSEAERKEKLAVKEAGEKFLEEQAKKDGVLKLDSGVLYKVLKQGDGPSPKELAVVIYEVRTIDGELIDSSNGHGVEFKLEQVISGFKDALIHMPLGSKWEVYIPYNLAYGEEGNQSIKPYSALVFNIELVGAK